jgi:hypothetical protein
MIVAPLFARPTQMLIRIGTAAERILLQQESLRGLPCSNAYLIPSAKQKSIVSGEERGDLALNLLASKLTGETLIAVVKYDIAGYRK